MKLTIELIGILSLVCGIYSVACYIMHPLTASGLTTYNGGKFWLVAMACLVILFLKG